MFERWSGRKMALHQLIRANKPAMIYCGCGTTWATYFFPPPLLPTLIALPVLMRSVNIDALF